MVLDPTKVLAAQTDDALLKVLGEELERRVPSALLDNLDAFVRALERLPVGLRSMAATHQLDVSMSLDDLGWHFSNWHHHGYTLETARGLRELGAGRAAAVFQAAYALALPWWAELGREGFVEWYLRSELKTALKPLNDEMWAICRSCGANGLMQYWITYARAHPTLGAES